MSKSHKKTDLELYYQSLSEIYLAEIENLQEPISQILIAKGILIEIESDLLEFLSKSKPTKKSERHKERIDLLGSVMNYFSNMAHNNYQMKLLLRKASKDLNKEKQAHSDTINKLEMITDLLNAE